MYKILGISSYYHDSAAALIIDGKIISAIQEERLTRIKNDPSFPSKSIKMILSSNNLKLSEIDAIVFYEKPFLKFERIIETYLDNIPRGFLSFSKSMPLWIKEKLFQKKLLLNELLNIDKNFKDEKKIFFSEHHLSHAASAFYPSPYENAVILTLDGVGEWATSTVSIGEGNQIKLKEEINYPDSLGLLYSAFTYYCGFKVNSGEYKLMGLAPYGEPKFKKLILSNLIDVKFDGSFKLNMKFFNYSTGLTMINKNFIKLFGRKERMPESEIDSFYCDVASSIQAALEEIILKICAHLKKKYNQENLCLAGGVALNCVANGKILEKNLFKNIWIQPASGDSGGSLGAALAYWFMHLNSERNIENTDGMSGSYLGPCFSENEIEDVLISKKAVYKKYNEHQMMNLVAEELSNNKVVGWFQGRMEFGPRALGNRSILADPRSNKIQKELNLKIKYRESFRPFAPSIIYEDLNEWFDTSKESPFMLFVSKVRKDKRLVVDEKIKRGVDKLSLYRSIIPGVTHVDYSARVQTVKKNINQKFYNLLRKFKEKTNCPILINTSFNVRGEPIVCNIDEAFNCFMTTDLDILVCENFILYKHDQKNFKN